MSQESDQPIHPNVLQAMRAQAYPEILDDNGMPWYINSLRERGTEVTKIAAERDALLAEMDLLRVALQPFADATADLDDGTPDHAEIWEMPCAMSIQAGDLRKAWSALNVK